MVHKPTCVCACARESLGCWEKEPETERESVRVKSSIETYTIHVWYLCLTKRSTWLRKYTGMSPASECVCLFRVEWEHARGHSWASEKERSRRNWTGQRWPERTGDKDWMVWLLAATRRVGERDIVLRGARVARSLDIVEMAIWRVF